MKIDKKGAFGTTLVHLLVLAVLIFFGFSYPHPPPEELGILVNFGTSETGLGDIEPAGDKEQGGNEETIPVAEKEEPVIKEKVVKPALKEVAADKKTQDIEEAPVKIKTPTAEELRQREIEKKKQEELAAKKAEEEKQRKIAEKWSTTGQSAFGRKGVGTTPGSEGITKGDGNQGDPDGVPGADNYGPGGGLGSGDFSLENRTGQIPKPVDNCVVTSRVIVKVQIVVDRAGNVVGTPKVIESNFQDPCIYESVIKAASKAKFNSDPQAEYRQQGWIRFTYEP